MADSELCIIGQEKSDTNIKLLEEAKKVFDSVFFVPISGIHIGLTDKFSITYRTTDLLKYKAILPRIPRSMQSYGYELLSLFPEDTYMAIRPIALLLNDERFFMLTVLRKRGIRTINMRMARTNDAAARIIEENNFPMIIRTPQKRTGVIVNNKIEAKSTVDALTSLKQPILIEDIVKNLVSVYVAEPEVLGAVKKKTKEKDVVFATGDIKNQKIDTDVQQLALDAARSIEAQIARVDISLDGEPKVVNVDLNYKMIKASKVIGVDLPKKTIEVIKNNYTAYKERPMLMRFFEDAGSVMKDVLKTKHLLI